MSENIRQRCTVPANFSGERIDVVATALFPDYSRARLQAWIKQGNLRLNDKQVKPKEKVQADDALSLEAILASDERWGAEDIPLKIVFEDADILVIDKQAGLVVHPAPGHTEGTLVNALLHHCPALSQIPRAGIVHRLDKDTSGIMVVAKSLQAHQSLVQQLQERSMGRQYEALVIGELTGGGEVDAPIGRHPQNRLKMAVVASGKPARTHYRIAQRFHGFTHVRLKLETGRTHQIRVHMAHIRHPIVGDPVYGGRGRLPKGLSDELLQSISSFSRQALHAIRLQLNHPSTGELCQWEVPLAQDMQALLSIMPTLD